MAKPLVVIGHRMGKGERIAKGVEAAGGEAYVIPGMLADMKLGDVMNEKNADIGLSFCGSGRLSVTASFICLSQSRSADVSAKLNPSARESSSYSSLSSPPLKSFNEALTASSIEVQIG